MYNKILQKAKYILLIALIIVLSISTISSTSPKCISININQIHKELVSIYEIYKVIFHPKKNIIAFGDYAGNVIIYDLKKQTVIKIKAHNDVIRNLCFNESGKLLATGSWDCTVKIWEIDSGKNKKTLLGHTDSVNDIKFYDDNTIISCGADNTIRIWDIKKNKNIYTTSGHDQYITGIDIYRNKNLLVSSSYDKKLKVWKITSKNTLSLWKTINTSYQIYTNVIDNKNDRIFFAGENGVVFIYDLNKEIVKSLKLHNNIINGIDIHDHLLATSSWDRTVKIVDLNNYKTLHILNFDKGIKSVSFNRDGSLLATAGWNKNVLIFESSNNFKLAFDFLWDKLNLSDFSKADNKEKALFLISNRKYISVFDSVCNKFKSLRNFNSLSVVAISDDGNLLAIESNKKIQIINFNSNKLLKYLDFKKVIITMSFIGNDRLCFYDPDQYLYFWCLKSNDIKKYSIPNLDPISMIYNSRDNQIIISFWNKTIGFLDLNSRIMTVKKEHTYPIRKIVLNKNGKMLASLGWDKKINIWSIKEKKVIKSIDIHNYNFIRDFVFVDNAIVLITSNNELIFLDCFSEVIYKKLKLTNEYLLINYDYANKFLILYKYNTKMLK